MSPFDLFLCIASGAIVTFVGCVIVFTYWLLSIEPHWRRIFQSYSEWQIGGPIHEPIRRDRDPSAVRFPKGDSKRDLEYHDGDEYERSRAPR